MAFTAAPLSEVGRFSISACVIARGRSCWLSRISTYPMGIARECRLKIAQQGFRMYVSGQPQYQKTSPWQEARLGGGESPCRNPKIQRLTAEIS
jgi:hypothetical protein